MTVPDPAAVARRLVARTSAGLLETDALKVAAALGLIVPRVAPAADALRDLDAFPGDLVVVKALAPGLAHKTELGGVRVVEKAPAAVEAAVVAVRRAIPAAERCVVMEFVPHDPGLFGELLMGVRWTDAFGPVMTVGLGGVHADLLAAVAGGPVVLSAGSDAGSALASARLGRMLPGGYRGVPGAFPAAALAAMVERWLRFAARAMPEHVAEFEVNPLVAGPGGPTALDARLVPGPAASAPVAPPRPPVALDRLLHPRTIAIVGVSAGTNAGRLILRNVLQAGFPANRVTVVKAGTAAIDGCRCVPGLADLAPPPDLLVLAVPASDVPALVEEATARRFTGGIVAIAGALGERPGTEALAAQVAKAVEAARPGGPVVNGGNSLGVRSDPGRYDTFFVPAAKVGTPAGPAAPVAVVAQSGAIVLALLDRLEWLRPCYTVSVGNQVDLTVGDYATWFAADRGVRVVACYVEGLRRGDGARLLAAARELRSRGGALVLYLAGRTPAGAVASASHTAAVTPDPAVAEALAAEAGALVAGTLDEFAELLALAVRLDGRHVAGLRLGAMSNAGFECVAIGDRLGPLSLAELVPATRSRLAAVMEAGGAGGVAAIGNPLDVTPMLGDAGFVEAAAALLDDPAVDVAVIGCVPFTGALQTLPPAPGAGEDVYAPGSVATRLAELFRRTAKAWVAVVDGGRRYDAMAAVLEEAGVPVFRAADRALAAFGHYCGWRHRGRSAGADPQIAMPATFVSR